MGTSPQDIYHLGVTLADHSLDWNFCEVKAKSLQAPGPGCGNISSTFGTKSEITDFSLSEASETWHYCFLLKELEILSQSLFFMWQVWMSKYVKILTVLCISFLNSKMGAICHNNTECQEA